MTHNGYAAVEPPRLRTFALRAHGPTRSHPGQTGGDLHPAASAQPRRVRTGSGTRSMIIDRWRWIALIAVLVLAAAAALSWSKKPVYMSSADVLVPARSLGNAVAPLQPDMGSELAVASSTTVRQLAAEAMHTGSGQLGGLSVSVPLNTHVLHFSYSAGQPDFAQRDAQAFALAYVTFWKEQGPQSHTAATRPDVAAAMVPLVISPANLPISPSSPHHVIDLGIALVIGLIAGLGAAWLRDHFDDRLRGVADLETQAHGPVLTAIPGSPRGSRRSAKVDKAPGTPPVVTAAYEDLRRLVVRAANQHEAKTVLVTSPLGDAHAMTAINLATSLARAHERVILICADSQSADPSDSGPGLEDVIKGRSPLANALHDTDVSGLQVLFMGEQRADGDVAFDETEGRRVLEQLGATAEFVVIDGPAAFDANIGGLSELTDMIVLVADARRTTRAEVRAAMVRLEQYDERILGWVLDGSGRRVQRIEPASSPVPGNVA
jgi:succinoglycan biosynthesis transport protein ExoP